VTLAQKCSALCKALHNRKNWIHFGSQEAGPRIAAIISIVETCRRLQIPIRDYLTAILPGLADLPISRVAALTPTA
jgi:transposase